MRHVISIAFALIGIVLSLQASAADIEKRRDLSCLDCNVILLDIDLLRADFVGVSKVAGGVTPNINEFFKNSIRFEDVSSSCGVTAISNTSTLTAKDGHFTYFL